MKIYVASSHRTANKTTHDLFVKTRDCKELDFFFPEHLGNFSDSIENMEYIESVCCNELRKSDVLIAIYPFGYSVSVEIGHFLEVCHMNPNNKRYFIILDTSKINSEKHKKLKTEAMIIPHVDKIVNTVDELINTLEKLN